MIATFSPLLSSSEQDQETTNSQAQLRRRLFTRRPSLTPAEMAFLSALLIDPPAKLDPTLHSQGEEERHPLIPDLSRIEAIKSAVRVLDDDMLFSLPQEGIPLEGAEKKRPKVTKKPNRYRFLVGLWQAHEDGVPPAQLSTIHGRAKVQEGTSGGVEAGNGPAADALEEASAGANPMNHHDAESMQSDVEVRDESDNLSDISWDDEEGMKHFDAWQVLKDEYAKDYGFDYTPDGAFPAEDGEMEPNTFQIIGTSAEDTSSHPHVLSPPLMDAIINFLPEHLRGQNMWMKYSLVRDGASLETFKQYSRASKDTVLAIETTKGHVFGCYVSQPWRTGPSFYGGAPSFIFKMRYNRNTPCHSLLEQAQMEGEIDVFFLLQDGQRAQVCTHKMIGVGEGATQKYDYDGEITQTLEEAEELHGKNYGFAIALKDDLLSGTTSKCSSYQNPCLVDADSYGEPFEVLNLELWTLTPCFSRESAEKLEMTQFFVQQSIRNMSITSSSSVRTDISQFSSRDLDRDSFYRRIGQGDDHEALREQWQYRNMMDGGGVAGPRGLGASPRFSNSTT